MPCMCGADDCPRCHPQNGHYVGRKWIYTGDCETDEDEDELIQAAGQAEEDRAVDRYMDSLEDGFDDRRFDP
jgi:hypothetical protein